jgi:hypothetical protein
LAHLSGDKALFEASFAAHPWQRVAAVWSIQARQLAAPGGVLICARAAAKVVDAMAQGWSAVRLTEELGEECSGAEASTASASFLGAFPSVGAWHRETAAACERAVTLAGRLKPLPLPAKADAKVG